MGNSFTKNILKTIVYVFLFTFVCFVAYFLNAFFGNPVSKALVKGSAEKYINEHYSELDLEKDDIGYDFKAGNYYILLQDKNSKDTYFYLYFDSLGRYKSDTKDSVWFNTWSRFSDELNKYGKDIEKEYKTPYEISLRIIDNDYKEELKLKIDQEVDFNDFPFPIDAGAYGFAENPNYDETLKILKNLQSIMDKTPLKVAKYHIVLIPEKDRVKDSKEAQSWKNALTIHDIPADFLRTADEQDLMEYHKKMDEYSK